MRLLAPTLRLLPALVLMLGLVASGFEQQPAKNLSAEQKAQLETQITRDWNESFALEKAGKVAEAILALEKSLANQRTLRGDVHDHIVLSLDRLARLHETLENFDAAKKARLEGLSLATKLHGEKSWQVTNARLDLKYVESLGRLDKKGLAELKEADAWLAKANAHAKADRYQDGAECCEKSLAIRVRILGDANRQLVFLASGAGFLWQQAKQFDKASARYEQAIAIQRKAVGENHPDFVSTLVMVALVYRDRADYANAEPLFSEALKICRLELRENHPKVAKTLSQLAETYFLQGHYAKAEPLYKEALEVCRRNGEHLATGLFNLASLYQDLGHFAKAEPLFTEALELVRKTSGEKHEDFPASLNNLAGLYWAQGDYAKAEDLFKQAMESYRVIVGKKHPSFAVSAGNLAEIFRAQGAYAKAEPLFKQAMEISRQEKHPYYAQSLNNLANLYRDKKEYANAQPHYVDALKIREQLLGEWHPAYAQSLNNLANNYRALKQYAKAEPLYEKARKIRKHLLGDKHPYYAQSLTNLAALYRDQGDFAKAESNSRQAVQIMHRLLEDSAITQSERQQLAHRTRAEWHLGIYLEVTANLSTASSSIYDPVLAWKGSVTTRQRLTRLARTELDKDPGAKGLFVDLDRLARQISIWSSMSPDRLPKGVDLPKKLADLTIQREQAEAKLSTRTEAYRRFKQSQNLTTAELQKHLPKGVVLVDFVEYDQKLAAYVVRKDRVDRVELGSTQPLREAAEQFRRTLKRTTPLTGLKNDPALVLREKLLDPLDKYLAGAQLVLIAPDEPLNSLPFAALPGKAAGKYLIEELFIAIIPVPQMLPELLAARPPSGEASLLAVGDVDFGDIAAPVKVEVVDGKKKKKGIGDTRDGMPQDWKRLVATRDEILSIGDTFRKAVPKGKLTTLRDAQPTEAAVRKLAPHHRFLHLATHGFFADKEFRSVLQGSPTTGLNEIANQAKVVVHHPGLLSGIVLAGANKPKDDDHGVLTALEVSELDLTKVELVVLSACETGLGEVAGGEGVLGLQRAFQIAGARTTITSLWKVDDEATRKLMVKFYDNYWKDDMEKLVALREAQLWMLEEGPKRGIVRVNNPATDKRSPPYYWAAFSLAGDWR